MKITFEIRASTHYSSENYNFGIEYHPLISYLAGHILYLADLVHMISDPLQHIRILNPIIADPSHLTESERTITSYLDLPSSHLPYTRRLTPINTGFCPQISERFELFEFTCSVHVSAENRITLSYNLITPSVNYTRTGETQVLSVGDLIFSSLDIQTATVRGEFIIFKYNYLSQARLVSNLEEFETRHFYYIERTD
jgi:hypothetical protein